MTAPTFPDDADELAAISTTIRPIVDAGKGRALALEIVRVALLSFIQPSNSTWLAAGIAALSQWFARALDIDTGRENERHPAERLTLLHIAGVAERISSMARMTPMFQPMGQERLIVYDLATALRRACDCSADTEDMIAFHEKDADFSNEEDHARMLREAHDHTRDVLLPLLIRDLRRLCANARVDPAPIEAAIAGAIAAHGGTPS